MGEMGPHDHRDDEFERLVDGQGSSDAPSDLGELVEALRRAAWASPTDAEDTHVAAMVETATHLRAEKGDPAATPASNADAPVPQVSRLPKRRGNAVKGKVLKPILSKGLAPVFALLTIFSGMAYAGVLPTRIQNAVESVVGANDGTTTDDLDEQGDADDQGEDADDQGQNEDRDDGDADDQGENGDHQGQNDDRDDGDADDQGEDADDQGEDGNHQGEDADDQGEDEQGDADDQGENEQDDEQDHHSQGDDDQGEEDDSQGGGGDQGNE
jgi:hypothetical protein